MPTPTPPGVRDAIYEALIAAQPLGLTRDALCGALHTGPWRDLDIQAELRLLWNTSNVARRQDATYVLTEKITQARASETRGQIANRRVGLAAKRVADQAGRRAGYDNTITVRHIDPRLLKAYCPRCRQEQATKLDGSGQCAVCGTQTGANTPAPVK